MARADHAAELETAFARAAKGERVILRRGGRRYALVNSADLARLAELDAAEERADAEAIDASRAELATGAAPRPLEELLEEHGV